MVNLAIHDKTDTVSSEIFSLSMSLVRDNLDPLDLFLAPLPKHKLELNRTPREQDNVLFKLKSLQKEDDIGPLASKNRASKIFSQKRSETPDI